MRWMSRADHEARFKSVTERPPKLRLLCGRWEAYRNFPIAENG